MLDAQRRKALVKTQRIKRTDDEIQIGTLSVKPSETTVDLSDTGVGSGVKWISL